MGLAASQARLLTLTSRSIDLELKCMRFSNQQIRNAQKACEISEDYNMQLDWLSDRYDASRKAQAAAAEAGPEFVNLTDMSIEDLGSYGISVDFAPVSAENGEEEEFVPNEHINYADHVKLVPNQTFDSPSMYTEKVAAFLNTYGTDNFKTLSSEPSRQLLLKEDFARNGWGFTSDEANLVLEQFRKYNSLDDMTKAAPEIDKTNYKNKALMQEALAYMLIAKSGGACPNITVNEKNVTRQGWESALSSAASSSGLDPEIFEMGVRNGGSVSLQSIQQLKGKYYVDYPTMGISQQFDGYSAACRQARDHWAESPEYKQWLNAKAAQEAGNGDTNVLLEAYKDKDKLWEYITNGVLVLKDKNQNIISDFSNLELKSKQSQEPIDIYDQEQYKSDKERLERDYDNQQKRLSLDDKKIQAQLTQVQTELNACNSEIQSVKTLIDKNIERGFSYGYNA